MDKDYTFEEVKRLYKEKREREKTEQERKSEITRNLNKEIYEWLKSLETDFNDIGLYLELESWLTVSYNRFGLQVHSIYNVGVTDGFSDLYKLGTLNDVKELFKRRLLQYVEI